MKYIHISANKAFYDNLSLKKSLEKIIEQLKKELEVLYFVKSYYYESLPTPFKTKTSNYLNLVIGFNTLLLPLEIIDICKNIENNFIKDNEKILKLILIDYNNLVKENENFCIPYKKLHQKSYILLPLYEINPNWYHSFLKVDIKNLLSKVSTKNIINRIS